MKCPHCESVNVIKAGKLRNKYVTKQGHRCKNCGHFFIDRDGFEGMTYPKEIVIGVLYLFVEGLSFSTIREFIHQQYGYWIYDGSILNWVRKYGDTVGEFDRQRMPKPKVKGINRGKRKKTGISQTTKSTPKITESKRNLVIRTSKPQMFRLNAFLF